VMNEPGWMLDEPSLEFTTLVICGRLASVAGAVGATVRPDNVIAYIVPAESTTIWRGPTFQRCVLSTMSGGCSARGPAKVVPPVLMSTNATVAGGSSRVAVVMFWRTVVVIRANCVVFSAAPAATLR